MRHQNIRIAFQSSDAILSLLDDEDLYTRTDHEPLRTVEDSKKVQNQFLKERWWAYKKPIPTR